MNSPAEINAILETLKEHSPEWVEKLRSELASQWDEITALKAQRDEMAEALGRAVGGLRRGEASAVFAELTHPDTIAAIRRARTVLNKEKTDG